MTRPCTQSLQKQRQHRHHQKVKHAHKKPEDAYKGERDQFLVGADTEAPTCNPLSV